MHTHHDDDEVVESPTLTAEQIAKLNTLVWDVEDDQAEGKWDLNEEDIDELKDILGIE